jgi:hypothetical protein
LGTFEKVGYAVLSSSGKTVKIYVDNRFVGLLSMADLERLKKNRNFVATIVKYDETDSVKPAVKEADPHKLKLDLW